MEASKTPATTTTQTKLPLPEDDLCGPLEVDLSKLLSLYPQTDPYHSEIWNDFVLDKDSILQKVRVQDFRDEPLPYHDLQLTSSVNCQAEHERRVAYLYVHGWDDPIELDVGVAGFDTGSSYPVYDGNHRIAAAVLRGDSHILANCSGEENRIQELL